MQILPARRRQGSGGLSSLADWDVLEDRMQHLMRSMPFLEPSSEAVGMTPRVDFTENDETFTLTAELPGVSPDDVEIEVEGNLLVLRGEKRLEQKRSHERIQMSERRYGAFERSFSLPTSANVDAVEANFQHGVLRVQIPKREETRGKKIKIQGA